MVTDANDAAKWVITGTWDTQMEIAQVLQVDESSKRPVFATGPKRVLWTRVLPPLVVLIFLLLVVFRPRRKAYSFRTVSLSVC